MTVQDFLAAHGVQGKEDLMKLVHAVASVPWGEARTVDEVLSLNKGTCTGKHLLLQECLRELDVPFWPVVCTFRWERQSIHLPPHLRDLLKDQSWEHGHNFVQIKEAGDSWIDVDVTWDPPLRTYGFLTLPDDWDGATSFVGLNPLERRWDEVHIAAMKEQLIGELSSEQRTARSAFLTAFIAWVNDLR